MNITTAKNMSKELVKMQRVGACYRVSIFDSETKSWYYESEFDSKSAANYELKEQQLKFFNQIMRSH